MARSSLAADSKVEERQIPCPLGQLQTGTDRPDFLELQRSLPYDCASLHADNLKAMLSPRRDLVLRQLLRDYQFRRPRQFCQFSHRNALGSVPTFPSAAYMQPSLVSESHEATCPYSR